MPEKFLITTRGLHYVFVYIVEADDVSSAQETIRSKLCKNERIVCCENIATTLKNGPLAVPIDEED